MSKNFFLLALILATACGKTENKSIKSSLGQEKSISSQSMSAADLTKINTICNAMLSFSNYLYSNSVNLTYTVSTRACGLSDDTKTEVMDVASSPQGGAYIYTRTNAGAAFPFQNVESSSSGVMGQICGQAQSGNLTNSFVLPSKNAVFISFSTSEIGCKALAGQTCIKIESGAPSSNGRYKITQNEFMRFNTDLQGSYVGFMAERYILSTGACSANQQEDKRAILTKVN